VNNRPTSVSSLYLAALLAFFSSTSFAVTTGTPLGLFEGKQAAVDACVGAGGHPYTCSSNPAGYTSAYCPYQYYQADGIPSNGGVDTNVVCAGWVDICPEGTTKNPDTGLCEVNPCEELAGTTYNASFPTTYGPDGDLFQNYQYEAQDNGCQAFMTGVDMCYSYPENPFSGYCNITYTYSGEESTGTSANATGSGGQTNTTSPPQTTTTTETPEVTTTADETSVTNQTTTTTSTGGGVNISADDTSQSVTITATSSGIKTTTTVTTTTTNYTTNVTNINNVTTTTYNSPTTNITTINNSGGGELTSTSSTSGGESNTETTTTDTQINADGSTTTDCVGPDCDGQGTPESESDYGSYNGDGDQARLLDAIQAHADSLSDVQSQAAGSGLELPTSLISFNLGTGTCAGIPYDIGKFGSGTFDKHCAFYDSFLHPALKWFFYMLTALYCFNLLRDSIQKGAYS